MTKDEARAIYERHRDLFESNVAQGVGEPLLELRRDELDKSVDAYAQAAVEKVLADTLGLLERLAKLGICCEWTNVREDGSCVTILVTHTGDGEYVYSQGVSGGVEYSAVHGDDGCTRAEALALLAGEEKKE